jgi:hypothetical protein
MSFDADLDLDDYNPATVDAVAAAGGMIPAGKYHARLDGSADRTAKTGTEGTELVFTILTGPFEGREVKDTLWNGDSDAGKNRRVLFGHRLGLLAIDPKSKKYVRVEGKSGFEDCLGAEVVIEVVHEADQKDATKKWPRLAYAIWAVDDAKVKDVPKAKASGDKKKPAPVNKSAKKVDTTEL